MAKRKRRNNRSKKRESKTLYFEIIGILLIALSVIAIVKGEKLFTLTLPFYYFLGEWYMAGILGVVVLGGYMMIKREWPNFAKVQLIGIYIIFGCILLLNHVQFVDLKQANNTMVGQSILENTHSEFVQNLQKNKLNEKIDDLGGGMLGAVLVTVTYFLFDSLGAKILSFFLVLIGIILITGKSIGDVVGFLGKKMGVFLKNNGQLSCLT